MSVPPWERDDRPGVKVFSKICPDCAVMDAETSDPRRGMRHASEFGLHYRSQDGLQAYCRHHVRQRRRHEAPTPAPASSGHLSAAAVRALHPTEETDANGHAKSPAPPAPVEVLPGTADVLIEGLAGLERSVADLTARLTALGTRLASLEERPSLGPEELGALATVLSDRLDVEARLHALEEARPAPTGELVSRLQAAHEALAGRVGTLERAEREDAEAPLVPGGQDSANTRSLRRWTKQLSKEVSTLATRVERAEGKTTEAVRLAHAAGRVNAGRAAETGATPALDQALVDEIRALLGGWQVRLDDYSTRLEVLERVPQEAVPSTVAHALGQHYPVLLQQVLEAADARVEQRLATLLLPKEESMTHVSLPSAPAPGPWAEELDPIQQTIVGLLGRYAAGLRNIAQIEEDGLLDADMLPVVHARLTQRTAGELRRFIDNLLRKEEPLP